MNFYRLTIFLSALACSSVSFAQRIDHRTDPKYRAELELDRANLNRSHTFLRQARAAIRNKRYQDAEDLCEQAIAVSNIVGPAFTAPGHGTLAETLVARKRYQEALTHIALMQGNEGVRSRMTHALALIGLKRVKEALALIDGEAGTSRIPTDFRKMFRVYSLPSDTDKSLDGLTASALVVRAAANETLPEDRLLDLETAAELFPRDASIEFLQGYALLELSRYEAAIQHFSLACELGNGEVSAAAKRWRRKCLILKSQSKSSGSD